MENFKNYHNYQGYNTTDELYNICANDEAIRLMKANKLENQHLLDTKDMIGDTDWEWFELVIDNTVLKFKINYEVLSNDADEDGENYFHMTTISELTATELQ